MDYQIGLPLKGLLFLTLFSLFECQIDRDIVLTPKLSLQVNGRTLYYKPTTTIIEPNKTSVPWEQTLKHVTFLTLHGNLDDNDDVVDNNFIGYKNFMNSTYIPVSTYIPKFGDIITLARGRLEKLPNNQNNFRFIEGQCLDKCDHANILAFWQVQKIRHRDSDRKYRYEIRFSVNPKNDVQNNGDGIEPNGKREAKEIQRNSRTLRSFILKDNDYPKSFNYLNEHIAKRRFDQERNIYLDRLNEFNEVFNQPRYFTGSNNARSSVIIAPQKKLPELNIGEYVLPHRMESQARVGVYPFVRNSATTYRPNYHVKFEKPYTSQNPYYNNFQPAAIRFPANVEVQQIPITTAVEQTIQKNAPITTHLHHHYYVKNNNNNVVNQAERPELIHTQQAITIEYNKEHHDTNNLIDQPLTKYSGSNHDFNYHTPSSISNQIPVPPQLPPNNYPSTNPILPSPPVYYMHSIPISPQLPIYLYDPNSFNRPSEIANEKSQTRQPPPFKQSEQIVNQIRYSDPDPLYQNIKIEENEDNIDPRNNFTPVKIMSDERESIENSSESLEKPDSINSQLPPPDDGQDLTVPYVENPTIETSSIRSVTFAQKQIEQPSSSLRPQITSTVTTLNLHPTLKLSEKYQLLNPSPTPTMKIYTTVDSSTADATNNFVTLSSANKGISSEKFVQFSTTEPVIDLPKNNVENTTGLNNKSVISTIKRSFIRPTTERPVLRWKPKRAKIIKETKQNLIKAKYEFEKIPVNITERVYTVTPSNNNDISTKKSVSASVSYKIGKENLEKSFNPKSLLPNLEVYEANLVKINTNDKGIKIFKAYSSRDDKEKTKSNDDTELTESIVQHVRSL